MAANRKGSASTRGVVVCPQPRAADVGAAVLADGGTAFDAAIASMREDGSYEAIVRKHTQGIAVLPGKR